MNTLETLKSFENAEQLNQFVESKGGVEVLDITGYQKYVVGFVLNMAQAQLEDEGIEALSEFDLTQEEIAVRAMRGVFSVAKKYDGTNTFFADALEPELWFEAEWDADPVGLQLKNEGFYFESADEVFGTYLNGVGIVYLTDSKGRYVIAAYDSEEDTYSHYKMFDNKEDYQKFVSLCYNGENEEGPYFKYGDARLVERAIELMQA